MVALCRLQSVSLNPVFLPPSTPFSFSSSASLSQHAADRRRHDIRLPRSILEPAAPHHFSFAFCFQVELVSALVNNQWEALQVPVRLLCLFNGSIICSTMASLARGGSQCPAQGHFSRKCYASSNQDFIIKGKSFFSHYTPCSFIGIVGCQYMLYVQSSPLTWRCNDPICPQGTLKFHLMCSNGVIQTWLKDRVLHLKPYLLSAVVAWF